ncbi:MAG TPA: F0F1 ATP synthase subunit B [Candidatus Pristimantibacillus sp.]|jgi:F-type H+-transporting ATPase subunit b|nr:F0F1 ATP synthase subunit B [Candidatus Pristimantibacillus sp.]
MVQLIVTNFAEAEASGIGALGINGKAFIIQLITFVLAFFVLKRFAFGPIVKIMNERRKTIEAGVELGEQMKKDQAAMEAKVTETLADARTQADGIIAAAHDTSRQAIREAEDKARDKAADILKQADDRITADTKRARKQLESELVGLISEATEAIIGEKVDAQKDAALIDRALKEQRA